MITLTKPLTSMTAADVMCRDLVLIPKYMSLPRAAHLLNQNQVSGAPVVNEDGVCVGVLSSFDFVHWAENGHKIKQRCECRDISQPWQMVAPENLPEDTVANYMTEFPVTATEETRINELARMMIDAHIHRIVVVDTEGRPTGIVSSTDLLAAVAYA